jgi:hypothetical protein
MTPAANSITPAIANSGTLCSDNHTICGNVVTSPAIAAPAPTDTNNAGNAQQINVLPLVKSDRNEAAAFCFSAGSSDDSPDITCSL